MERTAVVLGLWLAIAGAAEAQEQTFAPERVKLMRAFTIDNARSPDRLDCLETLNRALRILYDEPTMRLGDTVDRSMARLQAQSRAADAIRLEFDAVVNGQRQRTQGELPPTRLRTSLWTAIEAQVGDARGYRVFGLSPVDGFHSVLLVADTRGEHMEVFWIDQWESHQGWFRLQSRLALDRKLAGHTIDFWRRAQREHGYTPRSTARLYPLTPSAAVAADGPVTLPAPPSRGMAQHLGRPAPERVAKPAAATAADEPAEEAPRGLRRFGGQAVDYVRSLYRSWRGDDD